MPKLCKCGAIVDKRCDRCSPPIPHRKTTKERGYGHDWRKLSEFKRKIDPLCEECAKAGRTTPADHVHHIVPIVEAEERRLDMDNLMSVCVDCHEKLERGKNNDWNKPKWW